MYYHVFPHKVKDKNVFCSLQEAVLHSRKEQGRKRTIIIHNGDYYNTEVELNASDSGLEIVAAESEAPVLYGGMPVGNWLKINDRLWEAEFDPGDVEIIMLVVDGQVAQLARLPEQGCFQHLSRFDVKWMSTTYGGWERKPTHEELTTVQVKLDDLALWQDHENARLRIYHQWNESISEVQHVDQVTGTINLKQVCDHPPGAFYQHDHNEKAITYQVENIREGLTKPGQWYFNKTDKKLVYWPKNGCDPNESKIFAPTKKTMLKAVGASDIRLEGLTFSCAGVSHEQVHFGANDAEAAIAIEGPAEGVLLQGLTVQHVGGKGVQIGRLKDDIVQKVRVENCKVRNCGGPGIFVQSPMAKVIANKIVDTGLYYQSSLALKVVGEECEVRKNVVQGCPYTAITGGGKNAVFSENVVRDFMQKLDDGGAFYFFAGNHLLINDNEVYGASGRLAHAYYLDERSDGCIVENNLAENTASCFHGHMAKNCIFRNNIINDSNDVMIAFARCEDFVLEGNVFDTCGKIKIKMPFGAIKTFVNKFKREQDIEHLVLDKDGYDVIKIDKMSY